MPLQRGEGPIGIILAPSRELARQTYDLAVYFAEAIKADGGPTLRCVRIWVCVLWVASHIIKLRTFSFHANDILSASPTTPSHRAMLAIGGEGLREQMEPLNAGCHMVIGTPGRIIDHLTKKRMTLDLCRYMVLDEGDRYGRGQGRRQWLESTLTPSYTPYSRMLDMGFDEDIKTIFSYFKAQVRWEAEEGG